MVVCDLVGLINFIEKVEDINTSDTGYLYTIMTQILSIDNSLITLEGKTDILSLKTGFKVSDRTNVIRILDRLVKTEFIQYSLAQRWGDESVYITVKKSECVKYFFRK